MNEAEFSVELFIETVKIMDLSIINQPIYLKIMDQQSIQMKELKTRVLGRPSINYNNGIYSKFTANLDNLPEELINIPLIFFIRGNRRSYFAGVNLREILEESSLRHGIPSDIVVQGIDLVSKDSQKGATLFFRLQVTATKMKVHTKFTKNLSSSSRISEISRRNAQSKLIRQQLEEISILQAKVDRLTSKQSKKLVNTSSQNVKTSSRTRVNPPKNDRTIPTFENRRVKPSLETHFDSTSHSARHEMDTDSDEFRVNSSDGNENYGDISISSDSDNNNAEDDIINTSDSSYDNKKKSKRRNDSDVEIASNSESESSDIDLSSNEKTKNKHRKNDLDKFSSDEDLEIDGSSEEKSKKKRSSKQNDNSDINFDSSSIQSSDDDKNQNMNSSRKSTIDIDSGTMDISDEKSQKKKKNNKRADSSIDTDSSTLRAKTENKKGHKSGGVVKNNESQKKVKTISLKENEIGDDFESNDNQDDTAQKKEEKKMIKSDSDTFTDNDFNVSTELPKSASNTKQITKDNQNQKKVSKLDNHSSSDQIDLDQDVSF